MSENRVHRILIDEVLRAVEEIFLHHAYADKAIEKTIKNHRQWGSRDRRFFAETVYEMVRWWRFYVFILKGQDAEIDFIKDTFSLWVIHRLHRGFDVPEIEESDLIPKGQIKIWREALTKADFPNAVKHSFPDWLYEEIKIQMGSEGLDRLLSFLNEQAPVDLRVNTLRADAAKVRAELRKDDIETYPLPTQPNALTLKERKNIFSSKAFHAGLFEVQDRSSQKVAEFLRPEPGMRVCDACAGAGGKTLHIASLMKNKGRIISLDIHEWKLEELRKRAARNGVDIVETKVIDTTKVVKRMADSFDRVLLDVPCSGVGVIRRNPDTKWKLTPTRLQELNELQKSILTRYSKMVKKGGLVVYATCSILPSENQNIVEAFLKENPDFDLLEQTSLGKGLADRQQDGDGFFSAVLKRH